MFWDILGCSVGCSEMFWDVLGCYGTLRDVLGCSGMFWDVLGCTEVSVLSVQSIGSTKCRVDLDRTSLTE